MPRILVVDDDPALRDAVARAMRFDSYDVDVAVDGQDALDQQALNPADLVILDVAMPRMDGLEASRRLRAAGDRTPVLMLTARDAIGDRVEGLDAGADDYLVKPFALEELRARVRALLRRVDNGDAASQLTFGDLTMDLATREVTRGERTLDRLTRTEFNLLELFMRNPRIVIERDVIFDRVWGYAIDTNSNSLEVYVAYLRRKTEAGGEDRVIHTVRGVGYVLRDS
jgi:two-component system, OmpR family, response regulator MprA